MSVSLVLTVIGDDRPGLVGQLSAAISKHNGNWLESSMSHLAGKFAGIVCVASLYAVVILKKDDQQVDGQPL